MNYVITTYEEGGTSSEIKHDRTFMKKFPLFVREQFGFKKYILCKLFLNFPYAFNYIYYSKYELLIRHWIYNYSLPGYLASIIKPFYKFLSQKKMKNVKLILR